MKHIGSVNELSYQAYFQQRWAHLNHPHVRSLAWLLDSPDLLNPGMDRWVNKIAALPAVNPTTCAWLADLDKNPDSLIQYLAIHPHTRLGHYAEHCLAFYFLWRNELAAHSVQVRSQSTIGEFDFLLNTSSGLQHWEFACKFYLLVASQANSFAHLSNYAGPNLKDNLENKSKKILDGQLALGQHAEAKKYLPAPLTAAKALLKGWLFYPTSDTPAAVEVAVPHCRGLWRRLAELEKLNGDCFTLLSRLQWLAPAKVTQPETRDFNQLQAQLTQLFMTDSRPILIAKLVPADDFFVEFERIFVVPDEWNLE